MLRLASLIHVLWFDLPDTTLCNSSLTAARYSLLMLRLRSAQAAFTTHHSLLTTHHSLLTTHCSPLTTHYSLLTFLLIRIHIYTDSNRRHHFLFHNPVLKILDSMFDLGDDFTFSFHLDIDHVNILITYPGNGGYGRT